MKEPRLVMVPVDESEHSERALRWFAQNGWREGDRLVLFHSVDNSKAISPLGYTMAGRDNSFILMFVLYLARNEFSK